MGERVNTAVLTKGPGYTASSTTSLTITGSGSVTGTVQAGLAYSVGARVRWSYTGDPTKYMEGVVTAYNSTTGSMTFTADTSASSGTFASWNVNLGGNPGIVSVAGASGYVQFNSGSGALAADPNLFWDNTNKRLGIGTTPSFTLHVVSGLSSLTFQPNSNQPILQVSDGTRNGMLHINTSDGVVYGSTSNHQVVIRINNTNQVWLTTAGYFGIGQSPTVPLGIYTNTAATDTIVRAETGASGRDAIFQLSNDGNELWEVRASRADNHLHIGQSPSTQFTINGANGFIGLGMIGAAHLLQLNTDDAAKPTTSTWTVVSDSRTKQNVAPLADDPVAIIDSLNFITAQYNGLAQTPKGAKLMGVVAQDAQAVFPDLVRTFKGKLNPGDATDTDLLGVDYHALLIYCARAIQQIDSRIKKGKL